MENDAIMRLVSDDCYSNDTILTCNDENDRPETNKNDKNYSDRTPNDMRNFSFIFQKTTSIHSPKMTHYDIERTQSYDERYQIITSNITPIVSNTSKEYSSMYDNENDNDHDNDDVDQNNFKKLCITSIQQESPLTISRFQNDFDNVEIIGRGIFGVVYKAKGIMDGIYYAVKKSKRRYNDRNKMLQEVHALAALSASEDVDVTSTIVRYYSGWIEDDHIFITMELCEGNIETLLSQNNGSPSTNSQFLRQEVFCILRDILLALKVLHRNQFVHLDIKPGNIMRKYGKYKLGDFGLAVHTVQGKAVDSVEEGDSRYMANELLQWSPVEDLTKCDIFSLGITCYEISSGASVKGCGEEWHALRSDNIPFPDNFPNELTGILKKMMQSNPKNRPTASDCLENYFVLKSDIEKELYFSNKIVQQLKSQLLDQQLSDNPRSGRKLKRNNTIM